MKFLMCKVCDGDMHIIGEVSLIEPAVKCNSCGFTNVNKNNKYNRNKSKKVIVEYR